MNTVGQPHTLTRVHTHTCTQHTKPRQPLHYHLLDRAAGRLRSYRLVGPDNEKDDASSSSSWPLASVEMAAASLPEGESVVAVAYPDPQEVGSCVHSFNNNRPSTQDDPHTHMYTHIQTCACALAG